MTLHVTVLDMQPIDPPVGGGRLRLLGLYQDLGSEIGTVYIGSFDWAGPGFRQQNLTPQLNEILVPLSAAHFAAARTRAQAVGGRVVIDATFHELAYLSPDFVAVARAAAGRGDVVIFSHPWIYPLVRDVVDPTSQLLVYDAQNMEGLLKAALLDDNGGSGTDIVRGVVEVEHALCHAADLILVCSREDSEAFARVYDVPSEKVRIAANGAFTDQIHPATRESKASARAELGLGPVPIALFIGSGYGPNVDAARFIVQCLAPSLPDVSFVIGGGVGSALGDVVQAINVVVTTGLSDKDKKNWLTAADLAINPMFGGSGTNIKMLEFMAAGLPIVTTPVGARGLEPAEEAFVVTGERGFPEAIARLTGDPPRCAALGRAARREAERVYSWERIGTGLGRILSRRAATLGRRPVFSVIILASGLHGALSSLLKLLERQTYRNFEVIVVDRGARPWEQARCKFSFELTYIHDRQLENNDARNHGAELACGSVFAFIEEDCEPVSQWLTTAYTAFCRADLMTAEGAVDGKARFGSENLFIRNSAFHAVGGFHRFESDDDIDWRLQRLGDIAPLAEAVVRRPTSLRADDEMWHPLRLGWISTWGVRCGIAEYSRYLVESLPQSDRHELRIFADERSIADETPTRRIVPCWKTECSNVRSLLDAIASMAPDALVLQHHPALIPWDGLTSLLSDRRATAHHIVVVLHNAQHLFSQPDSEQNAVAMALQRAAFVLTHSFADLTRLRQIGLSRNVRLFPQGIRPVRAARPARDLPYNAKPRIGCFGFFRPHKGIYPLIQAVGALRREWPELTLRLVNAAYPSEDSAREIVRCRQLVTELDLDAAVEWETEFLPEERALDLLAECDVVALPYGASQEGSSAALRTALASGVPVAVTRVGIFVEADGVVAHLESNQPVDIYDGLGSLLRDQQCRLALRGKVEMWAARRAWPLMARRLFGLLSTNSPK